MNLIQRVAKSQSDPQRAEEARALLKTVPGQAIIQLGNKNATIRVHTSDPSGGVDVVFEVLIGIGGTTASADSR